MNTTSHVQKVSFVAVIAFAFLSCAVAVKPPTVGSSHQSDLAQPSPTSSVTSSVVPEPLAGTGDYFIVREDRRRCASPLCGGYFVRRVNQSRTRCADRTWKSECYVAEIDWRGVPEVEPSKALLRGDIVARRFAGFGNLGALRVTEAWQSPSDRPATGTFYRARDRGVRCITHPCLSHSATRLNLNVTTNVAGVDLSPADADGSEAAAAMTNPEGVMVAGYFSPVRGPAGRAQTLKATKFYLRLGSDVGGPVPGAGRCIKTGCSSEICADGDRVSPCIFRPEFACYQKAICARQANGECGFTQTAELTACLRRARQ